MTPLSLSLRVASSFLKDNNMESMQAENLALLADALQSAIGEYWDNAAPEWVKAPERAASFATVIGDSSILLPLGFDSLTEHPEISTDGGNTWLPLFERAESEMDAVAQGEPILYRIKSEQAVGMNMAGEEFNFVPVASLELSPVPSAVFPMRIRCRFSTPQITDVMLSSLHRTVQVPIPRDHLIRIVIPLTGKHLIAHPMARDNIDALAQKMESNALKAMEGITQRRSAQTAFVRTPLGF